MKPIFMSGFDLRVLLVCCVMWAGLAQGALTEVTDGPAERIKFSNAVGELWKRDDFAKLEQMSKALRASQSTFSDGLPKLAAFYRGTGLSDLKGEAAYVDAEKRVQRWIEAVPDSVSAPIVKASVLIRHGWYFRGGGYVSSVTDDGWKQFEAYLDQAEKVLEDAKEKSGQCPEWYCQMLTLGKARSWDRAKLDALLAEGTKLSPGYYDLYFERVQDLLPRWGGREGEWQAFAENQAAQHGQELYARIVWSQSWIAKGKRMFTEEHVPWPKLKAGFEAMIKNHPESWWNLNNYCQYACWANDKETARQLFEKLDGHWHAAVWNTSINFNRSKLWASEKE